MQKCVNLVDLEKCCKMRVNLPMLAKNLSIQPRTSPPKCKICKLLENVAIFYYFPSKRWPRQWWCPAVRTSSFSSRTRSPAGDGPSMPCALRWENFQIDAIMKLKDLTTRQRSEETNIKQKSLGYLGSNTRATTDSNQEHVWFSQETVQLIYSPRCA